jgi:hypothetical protein
LMKHEEISSIFFKSSFSYILHWYCKIQLFITNIHSTCFGYFYSHLQRNYSIC